MKIQIGKPPMRYFGLEIAVIPSHTFASKEK